MMLAALANILHTYFISRLGPEAIAAASLVFPLGLIMATLMAGGIGAGIASAIARALGAGHAERARSIAEHGLVIAAVQ